MRWGVWVGGFVGVGCCTLFAATLRSGYLCRAGKVARRGDASDRDVKSVGCESVAPLGGRCDVCRVNEVSVKVIQNGARLAITGAAGIWVVVDARLYAQA